MTLQDDIQALSDTEFAQLKAWMVTTETDRRAAQPAVEEAQAQLVEELWEQQPDLKPAYVGTAEPGTPFSGWEDVTDDLLKPVPVQDGNAEDADTTDAPGLITEPTPEPEPEPQPEPETTPAPQVQEWYVGAKIEQGTPWLHDGQVYIAKTTHTASASNAPGKSTRHWTPLPA